MLNLSRIWYTGFDTSLKQFFVRLILILLIFNNLFFISTHTAIASADLTINNRIIDDGSTYLSQPRSTRVQGNYLYVAASGDSALTIFDVTNPESPIKTGELRDVENFSNSRYVEVSGDYAFIVSAGNSKLHSINISNKALPVLADSLAIPAGVWGLAIDGDWAYISSNSASCFSSVNISNPDNLILGAQATDASRCSGTIAITTNENRLYTYSTTGNDEYLTVFDITNPLSPDLIGSWSALAAGLGNANAQDIDYDNGKIYLVGWTIHILLIIDVTDGANPTLTSSLIDSTNLNGITYSVKVGDYLVVSGTASSRLTVVNVSNPAIPSVVQSYTSAGDIASPYNLEYHNKHLYVPMTGSARVNIYDFYPIAPIITDISLISVDRRNATISWKTNETSTSQVEYGTSLSYGSTTTETSSYLETHSVDLNGLKPCTSYNFRVKSRSEHNNTATSENQTFTTTCLNSNSVKQLVDGYDWANFYQNSTSVSPNTDHFGGYVFSEFNNDLYLGIGNCRPADCGTGLVAKYNGSQVESVGIVDDEGINEIVSYGNTLYVGGPDPHEDWTLGNFYKYSNGTWHKIRTGSGLTNVIHMWGLYVDANGVIYAAVSSHIGDNLTWFGEIFKSTDGGNTFVSTSHLGDYRAFDVFGFNSKLYGLQVTDVVADNNLSVSSDGGYNWTTIKADGGLRRTHMIEFNNNLLALGGGTLNNVIYALDKNNNFTQYNLDFRVGVQYTDADYYSNYNEFVVAQDGYLYTMTSDGSIMRTNNLTNWQTVADTGKEIISIGYWGDQNKIVFSTRGSGASIYTIQLSSAVQSGDVPATQSGDVPATQKSNMPDSNSIASIIKKNKTNSSKNISLLENPTNNSINSTSDASTLINDNLEFSIKVIIKNNPVKGATIELDSDPKITTTNQDGLAHLTNIGKGFHKIKVTFDGFTYEKDIFVSNILNENHLELDLNSVGYKKHDRTIVFSLMLVTVLALLIIFYKCKLKRKV